LALSLLLLPIYRNCLIVEGGAKAAILPNLDANFNLCFENFVDAIIDLLIPGQSPGIKEKIVDLSGRKDPEVLFFGPDENTAGLMDWACFHARKRNAPWWKVRRWVVPLQDILLINNFGRSRSLPERAPLPWVVSLTTSMV
jgi:hypothetical protein